MQPIEETGLVIEVWGVISSVRVRLAFFPIPTGFYVKRKRRTRTLLLFFFLCIGPSNRPTADAIGFRFILTPSSLYRYSYTHMLSSLLSLPRDPFKTYLLPTTLLPLTLPRLPIYSPLHLEFSLFSFLPLLSTASQLSPTRFKK